MATKEFEMASKIEQILRVIRDAHVMGSNGLRDYHAARLARDANRCGTSESRFDAMRKALKNHRVTVKHIFCFDGSRSGRIEIRNPETGASFIAVP
jgi:PHP family Zn ribbon phosphoesterase